MHGQKDHLGLCQFAGAGWLDGLDRKEGDSFTMTVKISMGCLYS